MRFYTGPPAGTAGKNFENLYANITDTALGTGAGVATTL